MSDLRCTNVGKEDGFSPKHKMIECWFFNEKDGTAVQQAELAQAMAVLGEKYGVTANQLQHLFPAVLRMLGCNESQWSQL